MAEEGFFDFQLSGVVVPKKDAVHDVIGTDREVAGSINAKGQEYVDQLYGLFLGTHKVVPVTQKRKK